jgi:hypothetical protein
MKILIYFIFLNQDFFDVYKFMPRLLKLYQLYLIGAELLEHNFVKLKFILISQMSSVPMKR